jgi:hypothetical protein
MGLLARPNGDVKNVNRSAASTSSSDHPSSDNNVSIVELFDIPDSDELREQKRKRRPCPLTVDDQKYIARILGRYGDDYAAAFRDVKVNFQQHTELQLRKMGARFLLLGPEQRQVDVPERVRALMPGAATAARE